MNVDRQGLVFVVAPASADTEGLDLHSLVNFLSEQTGIPITLKPCQTYGEAMYALRDGEAQLGWLGPAAYVEAAQGNEIEPLAVGLRKNKTSPNYQSLFLAHSGGPVRSLEDIRGRRLAISDPHSTSGYQIPRMELAEIGIRL